MMGCWSSVADTNIRLDNPVFSPRADLKTGPIAGARTLICEDAFQPRTGQITDR
jgi:hypothetical protein